LDPPSGALALDAAAARELMTIGGFPACESDGRIVARNRAFFDALGYREVGLGSRPGMTVPTFAWLEKRIGSAV
jgi:hypothetical protein